MSKPRPKPPAASPATPPPPAAPVPPPGGLDAARHAAAQRSASHAEALKEGVFPAIMAAALGLGPAFDAAAYKAYLAGVLRGLGDPEDPVERMLAEQLCLAHFRAAQLHAGAGNASGLEATKLLNAAAARMLGEFRRTALCLKAYRTAGVPAHGPKERLKLFKAAQ